MKHKKELKNTVIREIKHPDPKYEANEAIELWGEVPELIVYLEDGKIGVIQAKANLAIWGNPGEDDFEARGLTKLETGEIIYIDFVKGDFKTGIISPKLAIQQILVLHRDKLLDLFDLRYFAVNLLDTANCRNCDVAE